MGKLVSNNGLQNISASLSKNIGYGVSYSDYAKGLLQDKINSEYEYATNAFIIQEELNFGSLNFTDIEVILNHVINPTTGEKLGDDFKEIVFKDISHSNKGMGFRYSFDNFYWLTINTDNYKKATASVIIRRCNHNLKWYDANRILRNEPCIIDYFKLAAMRDFLIENSNMAIPDKKCNIILQNNIVTNVINYNQRFIFNNTAWQVIGFDRVTYPGLITLNLEQHQINTATDDLVNEIANVNISTAPVLGNLW